MINRIMTVGFFVTMLASAVVCCTYSYATITTPKFSIPKDPYPSNTLVYKLKGFVKHVINKSNDSYYKDRVKEIVNKDIENNNKRINEGLDAYYEDSDHLHWILLYCTELADNTDTRGFYDEIEKAITKGVEMK